MRCSIVLFLAVAMASMSGVAVVSATLTPPPEDLLEGEPYGHIRPDHDERFNGHLAHYVTMSKITFSNLRLAKTALADIRAGTRTFLDIAKELSIENARDGRQNPELQNGDLGLITYDLIEEELAEVAFDIRNPIAKTSQDILGPVCSPSGCSLLAVFSRFRKSFFSDAWWEAEQYCSERDIKFSELLQRMATDEMSLVASVIWPHEHVVFKKLKIRQLKADVRRLNDVDPSTVLNVASMAGKKGDMSAHDKLMKRREGVFASMDPTTLEQHSEIYAMSLEQMVRRGFVSEALLAEVDKRVEDEAEQRRQELLETYRALEGTKKIVPKRSASGSCGDAVGECGGATEPIAMDTVAAVDEQPNATLTATSSPSTSSSEVPPSANEDGFDDEF